MADLPSWLLDASGMDGWLPTPNPADAQPPQRPQPGEIRAARTMDASNEAIARLVLILEVESEGIASVALVTNEVDLASDADVQLPAALTGTRFELLAQLGLIGPVWWAQLGPAVGRFDLSLLDGTSLERGFPLRSEEDARWPFKERELVELRELTAECMRAVTDPEEHDREQSHVDPELVGQLIDTADPRIARLLGVHGGSRFQPLPAAAACDLNTRTTTPELSRDQLVVVQSLLQESLRTKSIEAPRGESDVHWIPGRTPSAGDDALAPVVRGCLGRHVHSIRLATTEDLWTASANVYAAETCGSRIQLIPEDL